jgi:hypothetical protein
VISKTFFITGLGRSGTGFLASVLGRSQEYHVVHEWQLPPLYRDKQLRRFPLGRFWLARHPFSSMRRGYGEVNSHLRRTLSASTVGSERRIEKRALIVRDPRDVIASAMNRRSRPLSDLEAVTRRILEQYSYLIPLLNHPHLEYKRLDFDRFTSDPNYLQSVIHWAGIRDVAVGEKDVAKKVNVNEETWFPTWPGWESSWQHAYQQMERSVIQDPLFRFAD